MRSTKVAVVQAEIASDLASGLRLTSELTATAASKGAQLVVFPETWLPGYPAWLDVCRDAALWDHPPVKRVFARMADEQRRRRTANRARRSARSRVASA